MPKVAVVTGGGSGIGKGIARALTQHGIHVALVGREKERLDQVANDLNTQSPCAIAVVSDLSKSKDREDLVEHVHAKLGHIDILVHCAGVLSSGELSDVAMSLTEAVSTNLLAPMELTRFALDDLTRSKGSVVFIASTAGKVPLPYASVYSGTKHGLIGFAESVRYELEASGIHVLVVFPPMTDTAMTRPMAVASGFPPHRLRNPECVAKTIVDSILCRRRRHWGSWIDRLLDVTQRYAPWLLRSIFRHFRNRFRSMM